MNGDSGKKQENGTYTISEKEFIFGDIGDTSRSASSTPTQTSNFSPTTTSSVTEDSNSSNMTQ